MQNSGIGKCDFQTIFGSSEVPDEVRARGAQRFAHFRGIDGKVIDNYDDRVAKILIKYGGKQIEQIIKKSRYLGMTQSRFDYDQFEMMLDKLVVPSNAHNLKGLDLYEQAKGIVQSKLERALGVITPLEIKTEQDLMAHLPKMKSSAGYLGLVTGKGQKGDNLREILDAMHVKMDNLREAQYSPIVFGYRTNIRRIVKDGDLNENWDTKTRAISVVSAEDAAIEMLTAQPFMDAFCRCGWYAGGKNGEEIERVINQHRCRYNYWTSIDYSSYDVTIPTWLIKDCFDIIWSVFEGVSEDYKEFIVRGFTSARMIYPGGKIVEKQIGVPSGSYYTQAIDSIANAVMITMYFLREQQEFDMLIMGDDNLIFSFQPIELKKLEYFLWTKFKVVCNADKCSSGNTAWYSENCPEFLSREWTGSGAFRDVREVVVKAINPERFRDYRKEGMDEALIFYALMNVYPITFTQYFNAGQFSKDYPNLTEIANIKTSIVEDLPGSVRYKLIYLDHKTSLKRDQLYRMERI